MRIPRITIPRGLPPTASVRAIAVGLDGELWPLDVRWSSKTLTVECFGTRVSGFVTEEAFVFVGDSVQIVHFSRCVLGNGDSLTISVAVDTGS